MKQLTTVRNHVNKTKSLKTVNNGPVVEGKTDCLSGDEDDGWYGFCYANEKHHAEWTCVYRRNVASHHSVFHEVTLLGMFHYIPGHACQFFEIG